MEISIYKDRFGTSPIDTTTIEDYLEAVKGGEFQDFVLAVRAGKVEKDKATAVTVSALFDGRRSMDSVKAHSGFIGIDIDEQDNENLKDIRAKIEKDPYCYACHYSIRGFGLVWYVKIAPEKHKDSFLAIEQYLANTYNIVVDASGKDVSRLRYISYDPDLVINKKSKKWNKYIPKKEVPVYTPTMSVFDNEDMAHVMDQIKGGVNIADSYDVWLKISFALSKQFGDGGRDYFHIVSQQSDKYDAKKCNRQYDIALRRNSDGIDIGTFFWYCKEAGLSIKTEVTKDIESFVKQKIKGGQNKKDAFDATVRYFDKMEGVDADRVNSVLEGIKDIPDGLIKNQKVDDKVREMEIYIKSQGLIYNEITGNVERDGEIMNDRNLNGIYIKAMHQIGHSVSKTTLLDMIFSDQMASYNPFLKFFKDHKGRNPKGTIDELMECFEFDGGDVENYDDNIRVFIKKWLISIVASMHGTYSLLTLILAGAQGSGKTEFFRGLLPPSLDGYFAESKLDSDKDDGILMTQKLIILDDEFGGKSKRDAKRFKEISSRDKFTVRRPYGRVFETLKRYAVLCGTTNEPELLNDVTGNRRLIPVNLLQLDIERFKEIDKVDLFIEVYKEWIEVGNGWMLTKTDIDILKDTSASNEEVNTDAENILRFFKPSKKENQGSEFIQTSMIVEKINLHTSTTIESRNLGRLLSKMGFEKTRTRKDGSLKWGYYVYQLYDSNGNLKSNKF